MSFYKNDNILRNIDLHEVAKIVITVSIFSFINSYQQVKNFITIYSHQRQRYNNEHLSYVRDLCTLNGKCFCVSGESFDWKIHALTVEIYTIGLFLWSMYQISTPKHKHNR